ncbi:ABC transporter permease, partial [Nocardia zapadnayensis]|nr:ABC transporter permease [Nocardia zapadnayensis]
MTASVQAPELAEGPVKSPKTRQGSGLGRYILVRFLLIIPTVWILTTLVFFLMRITG